MSCCIDETRELEMKPYELCKLICAELSIASYDEKPKEIVDMANTKLERTSGDGTVKEEAQAVRHAIRNLPPSFWGSEKVTSSSSPDELVTRLLLKPASAGGFCTAAACKRLAKNAIDTKSIFEKGAVAIDGFPILASPGQYTTLDSELKRMALLFGANTDAIKFQSTVFSVVSREQVTPGSSVITCKANKCSARLVSLLTPRFCLVGFYNYAGAEEETKTLSLLEDLRLEAAGK